MGRAGASGIQTRGRSAGRHMRVLFSGISIQGRRAENQDSVWGRTYRRRQGCLRAVAALADGMGGVRGGARAAGLAVATVKESLREPPPTDSDLVSWVRTLFLSCHRRIAEEGQADESLRGMGTTLVLAAVGEADVVVGWVGDSRCYRVTGSGAEPVTKDHTVLQEVLDKDVKTLEELRESIEYAALSATLTRALGTEGQAAPDTRRLPIRENEIYFLCSDGLTGSILEPVVKPGVIHGQLVGHRHMRPALKNLASLAYYGGSSDNISIATLELGRLPRSKPWAKKEPNVE